MASRASIAIRMEQVRHRLADQLSDLFAKHGLEFQPVQLPRQIELRGIVELEHLADQLGRYIEAEQKAKAAKNEQQQQPAGAAGQPGPASAPHRGRR